MKRNLFYAGMVLFTAFALGACNKNTPDEPTTPLNPDKTDTVDVPVVDASISCTPEKYEVLSGVDAQFEVVVKSEMAWKATCKSANVTITPAEGKGETSVSIKAPATEQAETVQVVFANEKNEAIVEIVWTAPIHNAFRVSATQQVFFAPGNLQYQASTDTWRFAEHQQDIMGSNNELYPGGQNFDNSGNLLDFYEDPTVWIDLFGYSTAETNFGVNNSASDINYHGAFIDWGSKMPAEGGNAWRTPTKEEWQYVLEERPNATALRGLATVVEGEGFLAEEYTGCILLPDDWAGSEGVTFIPWTSNDLDDAAAKANVNNWSPEDLEKMLAQGAVWLPNAGWRKGSGIFTVQGVNKGGCYWAASSEIDENWAWDFDIKNNSVADYYALQMNTGARGDGISVRLVRNAQ
ncbi:MAG: hypothetical protein ACI30A_01885 [Paludibacteraceae bacterium]